MERLPQEEHKRGSQLFIESGTFGSAYHEFPTSHQLGESDHWLCWDVRTQIQLRFPSKCFIGRVADVTTNIINMAKFHGQRTYVLNTKEHLPGNYNNITHTTIATMLAHNPYLLLSQIFSNLLHR